MGPHETKRPIYTKGYHHSSKAAPTEWKKSFPINYPSDRVLLPKVSKELKVSISRKQIN